VAATTSLRYLRVEEQTINGHKWAYVHSLQKGNIGSIERLQEILDDIHDIELLCLENKYEGWIAHAKRMESVRHLIALGALRYAFDMPGLLYFYKRVYDAPVYHIREHMKKVRQNVGSI